MIHLILAFFLLTTCLSTHAAGENKPVLVVGTKVSPPFVVKNENGNWSGLSIDLWKKIARNLDLEYEIREKTLEELVSDLENQNIDIAVAALTMTEKRESRIDFTHPIYSSGYAIAIDKSDQSIILSLFYSVLSLEFLGAVLALLSVLLLAGAGLWLFERKHNTEQFGGGVVKGLGNALWWSAVTMTTVGYGDRTPITFGGRLVAMVWMFASIIIISGFTATIAASLTIDTLSNQIAKLDDLKQHKVATISDSTSEILLKKAGNTKLVYVDSVTQGLQAIQTQDVKAMLYDEPILRFYLEKLNLTQDMTIIPSEELKQQYAFAVRAGDELRERVNREMLTILHGDAWQQTIRQYIPAEQH
ncbi:transporter substrate-binding domain-containing protein [Pseudobacteriovorax antillogorgiicola]|uniref:Amino acid ABC transporter substrate-binding protein, PAAT family n=1 Tax=Pseudobacteriovorax antillogorgiicola TaxID=1513793 RepID=A0A1Y6C633_9BACT|nr:transporter substrate-binding domain-containing protein [Pseudobacteriovorax antillogorgiicola]TCS49355.1 amino acid ABC transporter substrate-binding protein (PAAT family) [Pseudobacteriovorax antillogorgiicola]SMF47585.1 amino acid ABC transporter substrate-binding protein, PAAT family [Pseudobacteriovorax antillogorgiicola]